MKRKLFSILLVAMLLCVAILPFSVSAHPVRLVDSADLLYESEEEEVLAILDEISTRQQFDVVIVTVDSLSGKTAQAYADDFYDYNGYGIGSEKDGALLLISMETREWHVSTSGYGTVAITDAGLEYMVGEFINDLGAGFYRDAFVTFAEMCDDYVRQARSGEPYDVGNLPRSLDMLFFFFAISFAVAFVIAGISVIVMASQLKSVRARGSACEYARPGSLNITESREIFLYRKVDRRLRERDNDGPSGGSSTHTSSSGRSHGGGGGHF